MTSPKEFVADLERKYRLVRTPSGDGEMVWQCWGTASDKTPLILLHGGYGSWTHWIANVERLSKDRLVVTCDMPGLGDSAEVPGDPTPQGIATPIVNGLDAVIGAGTRFDLVGFSFGGLIGSWVAALAKERCRTYIPVGASGFAGLHVRVLGIEVPSRDMTDDEKNETHKSNLGILMLWDKKKIDDVAIYTHRKNVARSRVRSRPMSLGNHLVDALPNITADIGGIWGVHDATGGGRENILKRRDIIRQFKPEAPMTIIEDAGHWVMYEDPTGFEAALLDIVG